MCKELSKHYGRTSDATHYDYFKHEDNSLYFRGRDESLINEDGKLTTFGRLTSIPGKNRLRDLGFDIRVGKVAARQAVILSKAKEEMSFKYDVANADDIELQEITKNATRSTENLIT